MRKCSAIRKLRSIILRKNPYNCLYFDLVWPKNGSIEQTFLPYGRQICYLYVWKLLCSALFEIMMDNSETPIVIYKKPEHKTSNAVAESDTESTLNESCEENNSEGNQKDSGYTTGK